MPTKSEQLIAERWIDGLDALHSAPHVVQQVLSLTRDLNFDARAVVACIESDPALAARILRVVNSSHYGLRQPAASIRKAALFLGQRSLRVLVLTFGLVEALTRGRGRSVYNSYWRRTLLIAGVAAQLAGRKELVDPQEAYTAGLLADIGVLAFSQCHGEEYVSLHQSHEHGLELLEAERNTFGCGHPVLGARLLARWEMPASLVDAVERHHEDSVDDLALTVRAADLTADAFLSVQSARVASTRQLLHAEFALDTDGFIDLVLSSRQNYEQMADLFGVNGPTGFDCDKVIAEARRRHVDLSLETAMDLDSAEAVYEDAATPA